jgi:hypothetical protein
LLCCRWFQKLPKNVTETHTPQIAPNNLFILDNVYRHEGARGGAVVEALRYKPEGRGIDGVIGIFH